MKSLKVLLGFLVMACVMGSSEAAMAGPPMDVLRKSVTRLVGGVPKREAGEILDRTLAYDVIAGEVLPDHRGDRTVAQQTEFMRVFSELLRRTYLKNLSGLRGSEVEWLDEIYVPKEEIVLVRVRAVKGHDVVDLKFKMAYVIDRWQVLDVEVEGSSMVITWRRQLVKVLKAEGFDGVMRKLRAKLMKG